MDINTGRDGPVLQKGRPRLPATVTAAPDPEEMTPQSACLNRTEHPRDLQAGQCGGAYLSSSHHPASTPSPSPADVLYDSGWVLLDDGRRVCLTLSGQEDGGGRAVWVRQSVLSSRDRSVEADDDGESHDSGDSGPLAGAGMPTVPRRPAGSGAVSVLV